MQGLAISFLKDVLYSLKWWVLKIATMADQAVLCRDACQPTIAYCNFLNIGVCWSVMWHIHVFDGVHTMNAKEVLYSLCHVLQVSIASEQVCISLPHSHEIDGQYIGCSSASSSTHLFHFITTLYFLPLLVSLPFSGTFTWPLSESCALLAHTVWLYPQVTALARGLQHRNFPARSNGLFIFVFYNQRLNLNFQFLG